MSAEKLKISGMLEGLNSSVKALCNLKNEYLKSLTPEQRVSYSEFERKYAFLMKNGDINGAQKLKQSFKLTND